MVVAAFFIIESVKAGGDFDNCDESIFPVLIGNDKGDTKIFAFDYKVATNRMVVAGQT